MTIDEAFKQNVTKLRLAKWRLPDDHIELYDAGDGLLRPWVYFYSLMNETVGNENPVSIPITEANKETNWVEWEGGQP